MGTRFRTMLAPIGASTGDGRRFQTGGISLDSLPMPFEWARVREGGHNGAVAIGVVDEASVMTVKEAVKEEWISADRVAGLDPDSFGVFARGRMFDDVDREKLPRLAEDVAESMHLIGEGTLGPSVDLDSFKGIPVMAGSDEEVTWELIEQYMDENDGKEPDIELLITEGRVRAATLVTIPAFAETPAPLELIAEETDAVTASEELARTVSLVASISAGSSRPEVERFVRPQLDGPTPITWDWETGRVFGHIATWRTCHVGIPDVCVTPPRADAYGWFNRYAVETSDGGTVWAGRITLGGRHAGLALSASTAMAEYDGKTVAAHVVAYEDDHGIVVAGAIQSGITGEQMAVLERRKVSGDWREISGNLALIEVLALSPGPRADSEPGFPVETYARHGRQVALTASFGPEDVPAARPVVPVVDVEALAESLERRQRERAELAASREELFAVLRKDLEKDRDALMAVLGEV